MPKIDPAYLAHKDEHQIDVTDRGWIWILPDGECHELISPFGTVHVTRRKRENVPHNQ